MKKLLIILLLFNSTVFAEDDDASSELTRSWDAVFLDHPRAFITLSLIAFSAVVKVADMVSDELKRTKIGVVDISGAIVDSQEVVDQVRSFGADPKIKALLLKIDSPGGVPGSAQSIYNELLKVREKKPIVVLIESLCASAAYYIACASDYIIANPSCDVGHVGVYQAFGRYSEDPTTYGFSLSGALSGKSTVEFLHSGKFKVAGNPYSEMTPEERQYFQDRIDDVYDQFCKDVAQNRGLDLSNTDTWANGQIFTGNQALKLGLIDRLGSISEAIEVLISLIEERYQTKIDGNNIKFVQIRHSSGLLRSVLFGDSSESYGALSKLITRLYRKIKLEQQMQDSMYCSRMA